MLDGLLPSSSLFVGYLGIDGHLDSLPQPGSNFWFMPHYDLERAYDMSRECMIDRDKEFMLRVSPDAQTLLVFLNMQFKDKSFWSASKEHMLDSLIDLVEARLIPDLSQHILHKEAATPATLFRYTRNYRGAAYGWASTPSQFLLPHFRVPSFIKGLFLAGHWTSVAQGIPGVVYTGSETARTVLNKQRQ
jgi:prolycopene isomerase